MHNQYEGLSIILAKDLARERAEVRVRTRHSERELAPVGGRRSRVAGWSQGVRERIGALHRTRVPG